MIRFKIAFMYYINQTVILLAKRQIQQKVGYCINFLIQPMNEATVVSFIKAFNQTSSTERWNELTQILHHYNRDENVQETFIQLNVFLLDYPIMTHHLNSLFIEKAKMITSRFIKMVKKICLLLLKNYEEYYDQTLDNFLSLQKNDYVIYCKESKNILQYILNMSEDNEEMKKDIERILNEKEVQLKKKTFHYLSSSEEDIKSLQDHKKKLQKRKHGKNEEQSQGQEDQESIYSYERPPVKKVKKSVQDEPVQVKNESKNPQIFHEIIKVNKNEGEGIKMQEEQKQKDQKSKKSKKNQDRSLSKHKENKKQNYDNTNLRENRKGKGKRRTNPKVVKISQNEPAYEESQKSIEDDNIDLSNVKKGMNKSVKILKNVRNKCGLKAYEDLFKMLFLYSSNIIEQQNQVLEQLPNFKLDKNEIIKIRDSFLRNIRPVVCSTFQKDLYEGISPSYKEQPQFYANECSHRDIYPENSGVLNSSYRSFPVNNEFREKIHNEGEKKFFAKQDLNYEKDTDIEKLKICIKYCDKYLESIEKSLHLKQKKGSFFTAMKKKLDVFKYQQVLKLNEKEKMEISESFETNPIQTSIRIRQLSLRKIFSLRDQKFKDMEDLDIKARHYESYYNQKSTWDETLEIKHFKEQCFYRKESLKRQNVWLHHDLLIFHEIHKENTFKVFSSLEKFIDYEKQEPKEIGVVDRFRDSFFVRSYIKQRQLPLDYETIKNLPKTQYYPFMIFGFQENEEVFKVLQNIIMKYIESFSSLQTLKIYQSIFLKLFHMSERKNTSKSKRRRRNRKQEMSEEITYPLTKNCSILYSEQEFYVPMRLIYTIFERLDVIQKLENGLQKLEKVQNYILWKIQSSQKKKKNKPKKRQKQFLNEIEVQFGQYQYFIESIYEICTSLSNQKISELAILQYSLENLVGIQTDDETYKISLLQNLMLQDKNALRFMYDKDSGFMYINEVSFTNQAQRQCKKEEKQQAKEKIKDNRQEKPENQRQEREMQPQKQDEVKDNYPIIKNSEVMILEKEVQRNLKFLQKLNRMDEQ